MHSCLSVDCSAVLRHIQSVFPQSSFFLVLMLNVLLLCLESMYLFCFDRLLRWNLKMREIPLKKKSR